MNRVDLVGRWTKDPELRYTPNGTAVAKDTLAVDRPRAREEEQQADFIPIVIWGKTAEAVANNTVKGQQIAVEGRIQVRNFTDKDGAKRWATEVVADRIEFLAKPAGMGGNSGNRSNGYNPGEDGSPVDEDDLPF